MLLKTHAIFVVAGIVATGAFGCAHAAEGVEPPAVAEERSYCTAMSEEDRNRDPFADGRLIETVEDLRCHEARLGVTALADRDRDPLAVDHPAVVVSEQGTNFVVAIRGNNNEDAREIVRRAKALQIQQ